MVGRGVGAGVGRGVVIDVGIGLAAREGAVVGAAAADDGSGDAGLLQAHTTRAGIASDAKRLAAPLHPDLRVTSTRTDAWLPCDAGSASHEPRLGDPPHRPIHLGVIGHKLAKRRGRERKHGGR